VFVLTTVSVLNDRTGQSKAAVDIAEADHLEKQFYQQRLWRGIFGG